MAVATDRELLERWRSEPAPLLPLLHAFHERDGFVTEDALRAISRGLRTPLADLFGTVTFYHHLAREPGGAGAARVCTGLICRLNGAVELLERMRAEGAKAMPCSGGCDDPVHVLVGDDVLVGTAAGTLERRPALLPPLNPGDSRECVFSHIRTDDRARIDVYEDTGGYEALKNAVRDLTPQQVIEIIAASGLNGRGGAGFHTGTKWKLVAEAPGEPKTIVCNADEGEPGCFKDRVVMDYDPHAVIEGMALAAYATGATRGFIYLRYEYPRALVILENAIAEARQAGYLGESVLGTGSRFEIYVRRGAGAYICGEEGALLNSLEGRHPFPRNRPPFPVTRGYENKPTVVNNVETLAAAAHIVRNGADWYQSLGIGHHAGTKIVSLSGDIQRPGNYEVPLGFPLRTLLDDWAGGARPRRAIQAVTMAGLSGGFLVGSHLDITLDEPSLRSRGLFLGAGGIMVFDDSRDMIEMAHAAMEFFVAESCGKCFPCRIGTQRLEERLAGRAGPSDLGPWLDEVNDIGRTMKAISACGLGTAAPLISESLVKYFPEQVERHVRRSRDETATLKR
ncbi:MAG: NAD(P)H-dependent oxidoreductase subunit E [Gemmatimonadota bacterium]|nr:MAG: NAD(P)H-dependent oxidoreductase subunit E [Gemmatimonadota bacterium]